MTRKDYAAFAAIVRDTSGMLAPSPDDYQGSDARTRETLDCIMLRLADLFARDNPRFDRARFLAACERKG